VPSVSKKQAHLFAAVAHNPAFAKRVGIPESVGREFNHADQGSGMLNKADGGRSPALSSMEAHTNFGQGRGHSMFSTMPLQGHAMSGTQLGQADALIGRAQKAFSEGGSVKKDSGSKKPQMSAKERGEVRALIERGKTDAVTSLRSTRAMLLRTSPASPRTEDRAGDALARLSRQLSIQAPDPQQEYAALMAQLENAPLDPVSQRKLLDRLAMLSEELDQTGLATAPPI
jgi:hypothetical protein